MAGFVQAQCAKYRGYEAAASLVARIASFQVRSLYVLLHEPPQIAQIAEIRCATTVPLDMYVEVPDDQGGSVRFYDVPEAVRVAAPVYLKLGVRNAPNIYPVGRHIAALTQNLGRERCAGPSSCYDCSPSSPLSS